MVDKSGTVISSSPATQSEADSQHVQETPPRKTSRFKWFLGLFWDTYNGDTRERKYVQKVDIFLFSYIMLGYFIKYLDQQNYSNAFVSGMKEDLKLYGNQRNLLVTYFNIGMIVGTVPSQLIQLKYVRPSIWIPSCEIAWAALVASMAAAKRVETLYALRFCVGLLESCAFPGYAALLGSWYSQGQLSKRVSLFEQSSAIASMFSGYLQAGIQSGLNGRAGLAGWRWLFIFDAIISFPIAIWGYFAIPDLPNNTRAFYLNKNDREYGIERLKRIGRAPPKKLTLKRLRRIYTDWHMWVFIWIYLMVANANLGPSYFNLWLKAEKYTVYQINTIPTAGNALNVVASLFFGTVADRTGLKPHMVIVVSLINMVANIFLSIWHINKGALFFAFFLSYVGGAAQPIAIAWGYEMVQSNAELRQLLVATGNIFTYTFSAWLPLVLFPTYDAPHYKYAYQMLIMFGGLAIIGTIAFYYLHEWELRNRPTRVTESGEVVVILEEEEPDESNDHEQEALHTDNTQAKPQP